MLPDEFVIYGGTEICRLGGRVRKSFDGINETEYCMLIPSGSKSSAYYVPADKLSERVRPLLSREEILAVIDAMPDAEALVIEDKNQRKSEYSRIIKSDDYRAILSVMKTLYTEQKKRDANGKKMISAEEKALTAAQKLLRSEFSIVLGIAEDEVDDFIAERLCGK